MQCRVARAAEGAQAGISQLVPSRCGAGGSLLLGLGLCCARRKVLEHLCLLQQKLQPLVGPPTLQAVRSAPCVTLSSSVHMQVTSILSCQGLPLAVPVLQNVWVCGRPSRQCQAPLSGWRSPLQPASAYKAKKNLRVLNSPFQPMSAHAARPQTPGNTMGQSRPNRKSQTPNSTSVHPVKQHLQADTS